MVPYYAIWVMWFVGVMVGLSFGLNLGKKYAHKLDIDFHKKWIKKPK
jgi:hypothetical protein